MSRFHDDEGPPDENAPAPVQGEGACQSGETERQEKLAPSNDRWKVPLAGALEWASAGYPIFPCLNLPSSKDHKRPLTGRGGFHNATTDKAQIEAWWRRHPDALIGIPTGTATGIAVLDLDKKKDKDGYAAVPNWRDLSPAIVQTGGGGAHLYFKTDGAIRSTTGANGVDVRGEGGYVIVPPSAGYSWLNGRDLSALPPFPPEYRPREYVAQPSDEAEADPAEVAAALRIIPNDNEDYDSWVRVGLAVYGATGGSDEGFEAWDRWSEKSGKYCAHTTAKRWEKFHRSPPNAIGAGTIFHMANEADPDWRTQYNAEVDASAQKAFAEGAGAFAAELWPERPVEAVEEPKAEPAGGELPSDDEARSSTAGEAELDDAARGKPPSALGEWNAGIDDWTIPPRRWLLGNVFCRSFVSALIADGGIGKTALRIAQALSLATRKQLTGEKVFQRCRVLFVSLEDDRNELRRRVRAAMLHHGITDAEVDGWLFLAAPEGKAGKLVTVHPRTKRPAIAAMKAEIEAVVTSEKIDLLILDPLVKAHDVEENDNSAMDVVIQTLSSLAVDHDIAVDVLHHTSKGAADPGNADRGRGASAVKNGARLVYTLTQMSTDEAERFGVDESERRSHVRVDSGKVNITPPLERAQWFKIVGVPLGNADALYPNGDRVQTMVPWTPPTAWEGITGDVLKRILDDIDKGVPPDADKGIAAGGRYSNAPKATTRAAWQVVARHAPGKTEKQCRQFIAELVNQGRLMAKDYRDPNDRRTVKGLYLPTQEDADNVPV